MQMNIEKRRKDLLLEVKDLKVSFFSSSGEIKAVRGISYKLNHGEIMGIVGESGCGKSVGAHSIMRLLKSPGKILGGSIYFEGKDILKHTDKQMRSLRGNKISMIFQNPMACLNPVYTVGNQLIETVRCHENITKWQARGKAIELLELVGINNPEKRMSQYPHEFSGGMGQRVMIAMALICGPKLLIADEPTTALDATTQAQTLETIKRIQKVTDMAIIFITHNLGLTAEICDRISVMYAGKIVEQGSTENIFYNPRHPYTMALYRSIPNIDMDERQRLVPIEGTAVDMLNLPTGCPFASRCEHCMKICLRKEPNEKEVCKGHMVACWLLEDKD